MNSFSSPPVGALSLLSLSLSLHPPDLLVNVAHGPLVCGFDGVGNRDLRPSIPFPILRVHIHFVEHDQVIPPAPVGVHVLVSIHRFTEANDNEGREREILPACRLVFTNVLASPGHVRFGQAMDRMFSVPHIQDIDDHPAHRRKRDNRIALILPLHQVVTSFDTPPAIPAPRAGPVTQLGRSSFSNVSCRRSTRIPAFSYRRVAPVGNLSAHRERF